MKFLLSKISSPVNSYRRIILMMVFALTISMPVIARKSIAVVDTITAGKAFLLMPQQDLDLLSKSMRQDMLDYMEQRDSIYKKANVYMGLSWIEVLRPDYMRVHLSNVSSLQIKLLHYDKSKLPLVMTVYTIDDGNGTADSTVKFFDNSMQELPTQKFLTLPKPEVFYNIPKDAPITRRDIEDVMPFYTMSITVNPQNGALTGKLTSANGLTIEEAEKFKPYIHPELQWTWTGTKMHLMK